MGHLIIACYIRFIVMQACNSFVYFVFEGTSGKVFSYFAYIVTTKRIIWIANSDDNKILLAKVNGVTWLCLTLSGTNQV